jgi:ABC-type antimicrobial peptide transport system permease subunit
VVQLVLQRGFLISLAGTVAGLLGANLLTRGLDKILYGVTAHDPWVFAGITLLMLGVSILSGLIPAWRATKIAPSSALRYE